MAEIQDSRRVTAEDVKAEPQAQYETFTAIMDRVQVRVLDEKVQDPTTGIFMPPVYRQHSNKGIVVTIGQWVVIGGKQIPMGDVIKVGDKILFGEYNCEKFIGVDGVEYELVRVQDIRGVERLVTQETQHADDSQ